jgi:hypothetical protein
MSGDQSSGPQGGHFDGGFAHAAVQGWRRWCRFVPGQKDARALRNGASKEIRMSTNWRNEMKAVKFVAAIALVAGLGLPAMSAEFGTKDEAVAMVNKAVAYIKKEGVEKAYAEFDKKPGEFTDRDLYVLVYGTDGHVLAHGSNVKLVGKDMNDAQDVDGKYYVKERIELAAKQKTFWQDYKFTNPVTKKIEPKQAYCEVLDQSIICSGVYKQ